MLWCWLLTWLLETKVRCFDRVGRALMVLIALRVLVDGVDVLRVLMVLVLLAVVLWC
jgi:hypothetical protein